MSTSVMDILVTGGVGFIGSSLIPVLLGKGYRVTVVDHLTMGKKQNVVIFRLANIVEPSSGHGVIFDLFRKLKKSYLYIDDCVDALVIGRNELGSGIEIFNVGSDGFRLIQILYHE